ncbi:MAG TPA: TIGR03618 family F420-dependent PPOX class oxidoreductase [Jatrophihabitans sp.]
MAIDLAARGTEFHNFWSERHLASLTTIRPDGSPHVTPVGVTVDFASGVVRIISSAASRKVRNVIAAGENARVAVCQLDGRRWSTLEGVAVVRDDPTSVADGEARYAVRYRPPRPNITRVVIEIAVDRVLGNR